MGARSRTGAVDGCSRLSLTTPNFRRPFRTVTIINNLKWGVRWGLIIAIAFTGIAVVVTVIAGPDPRGGPSVLSFISFYFLGGTVGGLLVGLLRPLIAHKAGAIFVGTIVAAAVLSLLDYLFVSKDHWQTVDTELVAILSLIGGPVTTLMIWEGKARLRKDAPHARDHRHL